MSKWVRVAAEDYVYKLPEDYTMKPETRGKLDALVKKTRISNKDAQAFIDIHVELMEEYAIGLENANASKAAEYLPPEMLTDNQGE